MENAPEPMIYRSLPGLVLQLFFFFLVPTSSVPKPMRPRLGCCLRGSQVELSCVDSVRFSLHLKWFTGFTV